jgi:hypothetical protein
MNIRMLGPAAVAMQQRVVNGRSYSASAGQEVDVIDVDAQILAANGWIWVAPSGTTAQRPVGSLGPYQATEGSTFFDASLGYVIKYAGGAWRNPTTGVAV